MITAGLFSIEGNPAFDGDKTFFKRILSGMAM
jgi:hypothetical protein